MTANVHRDLAESGESVFEQLGEFFLRDRFIRNCALEEDRDGFDVARVERFTRACFPRILLDPNAIDAGELDLDRLKADFTYILKLIESKPEGFKALRGHLDDPAAFAAAAREIGLTEHHLKQAGGALWWVVVVVAAVALTGCTDSDSSGGAAPAPAACGAPERTTGTRCVQPAGHGGKHFNGRFHW